MRSFAIGNGQRLLQNLSQFSKRFSANEYIFLVYKYNVALLNFPLHVFRLFFFFSCCHPISALVCQNNFSFFHHAVYLFICRRFFPCLFPVSFFLRLFSKIFLLFFSFLFFSFLLCFFFLVFFLSVSFPCVSFPPFFFSFGVGASTTASHLR